MASTIINKIRKLLRLAKSDNLHEAANALAKARSIAEKYNIGLELLGERSLNKNEIIFYSREYGEPWIRDPLDWESALSRTISDHNYCKAYFLPGGSKAIDIIGLSRDIEIASSMFFWLRTQLQRLIIERAGTDLDLDSFLFGAVYTVDQRLQESTQQARDSLYHGISNPDKIKYAIQKMDTRRLKIQEILESLNLKSKTVRKNKSDESWMLGAEEARKLILGPVTTINEGN